MLIAQAPQGFGYIQVPANATDLQRLRPVRCAFHDTVDSFPGL